MNVTKYESGRSGVVNKASQFAGFSDCESIVMHLAKKNKKIVMHFFVERRMNLEVNFKRLFKHLHEI